MKTFLKLDQFRSSIAQFITFNEEEWQVFIQHLTFLTIKKKDHFAVEGKVCDEFGFIVSGSMRYYHLKDGTEITGYFSVENELVSSYKSFITRKPGKVYIQALVKTELILITYPNMQLMLNNPLLAYKMERFGRLIAEYCVCCYEDRITAFITQTPGERYLEMVEKESHILLRIPQHYIANYLGITPVSLSRIRKRTVYKN